MATTMTRKEVAERLGVSGPTVDKLEREGILKRLRYFDTPRYSVSDIEIIEAGSTEKSIRNLRRRIDELEAEVEVYKAKLEGIRRITG
ncbi:MAG: hypothetical protein K0M69_00540 [Youngiibacter sp.]|nr:hypothetical protein [Youngiibacter sp.]